MRRVSFRTRTGRVSFNARGTPRRSRSSSSSRVGRHARQFAEAAVAYAYPPAPVIIAGARLVKDFLR